MSNLSKDTLKTITKNINNKNSTFQFISNRYNRIYLQDKIQPGKDRQFFDK